MVASQVACGRCHESCYGDVVNTHGLFFHQQCFTCDACGESLVDSGFFYEKNELFCVDDYNAIMGTKCSACRGYVEGEIIHILGQDFHPECFRCSRCGSFFPAGANITMEDDDYLCDSCVHHNERAHASSVPVEELVTQMAASMQHAALDPIYSSADERSNLANQISSGTPRSSASPNRSLELDLAEPSYADDGMKQSYEDSRCAGCGNDIKSGQALLALDKQWHLWCFTCQKCGCLLAGEYMGRDGLPYCEQDYQMEFGVSCSGCGGYISGKVLQAGEKHYHPHCSRCAKCGKMFGEGEEMYLQGSEIWHPHCSEEFQREQDELNYEKTKREAELLQGRLNDGIDSICDHQPSSTLIVQTQLGPEDANSIHALKAPVSTHVVQGTTEHSSRLPNIASGPSSPATYPQPRDPASSASGWSGYHSDDSLSDRMVTSDSSTKHAFVNGHDQRKHDTSSTGSDVQSTGWQAPSIKSFATSPGGSGRPLSISGPQGYRSVKAPQPFSTSEHVKSAEPVKTVEPVKSADTKSRQKVTETENMIEAFSSVEQAPLPAVEEVPVFPPPPARSSSMAWKQRYSGVGVYAPKPFEVKTDSARRSRPMSYVESSIKRNTSEGKATTPASKATTPNSVPLHAGS